MSEYVRLLEHEIHIAALSFMGIIYMIRIFWLFRFKAGIERGFPRGGRSHTAALSFFTIARPWSIEKYRRSKVFYAEFATFHIGAATAISITFIIPHWPELLAIDAVVRSMQIILTAAFFVGVSRLYCRISYQSLKIISTWDDYCALIMMNVFFVMSIAAISNCRNGCDWIVLSFFLMTTFFHLYVPFSKIIHYLYYPFIRYYLGKTMAHRGIDIGCSRYSSGRDKT